MAPLSWTPRALRALEALRGRTGHVREIELRQAFSALAADTLPGETVIGRALRDPDLWPGAMRFVEGRLSGPPPSPYGHGIPVDRLEFAAENEARRDRARKVGERHLLAALIGSFGGEMHRIELHAQKLLEEVRLLELGPAFLPSEIEGRWHGLIDANVVAHSREIRTIDWRKATGSRRVTVWATAVLLDELDRLAYDYRKTPAAGRVRVFNRWLRPLLPKALEPGGYEFPGGSGTRLRVWVPPMSAGPPDERHLSAAEELLERGVPSRSSRAITGWLLGRSTGVWQLSSPRTTLTCRNPKR